MERYPTFGIDWTIHRKDNFKQYLIRYKREDRTSLYFCRTECVAHQLVIILNENETSIGALPGWRFIGVSNT
jgi:hypothetical protein